MAIKLRLKHSSTANKAPLPTDLVEGELALNINNTSPAAYIKDSAGAVVKLAGIGSVSTVDATETAKGIVELATVVETTTGTDDTRAVHPAGLKVELDKKAAKTTTSDTAPTSPSDGDLWYDSVGGRTYVYYQDPTGSQWVDIAPQGGGGGGGGGGGTSSSIVQGNTSASVVDTGSDGKFVVTTEGTARMTVKTSGIINFSNVPQYTDNATALASGLVPGDLFRNIAGILVIAS